LLNANIFRTVVIQLRTSALFVVKTNIEIFKIYSVSTSDMDRVEGRGIEPVLTLFLDKGRSIFHDFGRRRLWIWTLSKNTAKLSMGYRPTNCNS